ncbi:MAG: hypothetical protein PF501_07390 [Salinisphaera sp.]|nr:hypothetical protein [Salinisphaera sp.]
MMIRVTLEMKQQDIGDDMIVVPGMLGPLNIRRVTLCHQPSRAVPATTITMPKAIGHSQRLRSCRRASAGVIREIVMPASVTALSAVDILTPSQLPSYAA